MAEDNGKQSREDRTRVRISEVKGKIVENIEIYVTSDHYSVNVNFNDKTAMVFSVEPFVAVSPYYADWTTGERKMLKEWEPIKSISLSE